MASPQPQSNKNKLAAALPTAAGGTNGNGTARTYCSKGNITQAWSASNQPLFGSAKLHLICSFV